MKAEVIKEQYDINPQLNALYDTLDALYDKYKDKYPNEVKRQINILLNTINNYVYPKREGYDIVEEKCYFEFTFKKNIQ